MESDVEDGSPIIMDEDPNEVDFLVRAARADNTFDPPNPDLKEVIRTLQQIPSQESLERVVKHTDMKTLPPPDWSMAKWMDSLIDMIDLLLNTVHFQ